MFVVAILSSLNYSPQVSASGEDSSFGLRSRASLKAQHFAVLHAWTSTMPSEGGIKVSTFVWRSTRGVAVESFAPCQDPESKSRACKASKCKCHPPVLNARLGLQAPRRMGACEFLRSSITCLMVPGANSWQWLRELRVTSSGRGSSSKVLASVIASVKAKSLLSFCSARLSINCRAEVVIAAPTIRRCHACGQELAHAKINKGFTCEAPKDGLLLPAWRSVAVVHFSL